MPEYLSPGVYVEEIPSAVKPIAGVSTSTACFLGVVPDTIQIPRENPSYDPTGRAGTDDSKNPSVLVTFTKASASDVKAKADAVAQAQKALSGNTDPTKRADLAKALAAAQKDKAQVDANTMADDNTPVLCTNFTDFKRSFGDFSTDPGQSALAHAVYGFFNNGGTRCYVMRCTSAELSNPETLTPLEAIDEISMVAAPGFADAGIQQNLVDHCANTADRFAILDPPLIDEGSNLTVENLLKAKNTDYGALYFPRISVFDIASKLQDPNGTGDKFVSPSGHIAGIYSRVDHERGVHKAPANEVIRGALDVEFQISRNVQDGLNPAGVNCIRFINNNITVWGARTIGGDANTDLKYINVRRTLIFLRESIDRGTQWVVFEPNDRSLWAKITRNVTAFLTTVWRDGALFGSTPQEAFYVKCDDETNPPEERDLGRVTTEIGVAIVRPAEFVIFRISQWSGPQGQQ